MSRTRTEPVRGTLLGLTAGPIQCPRRLCLAMDFYGPRIGQGGGALSGKHLTHIDRIGSYGAREAALRAVRAGARSCRVQLAYAPNCPEPLEVAFEMEGPGQPTPRVFFDHDALREHYRDVRIPAAWGQGTHFWDLDAPWNQGAR